jgi:hypothetical protein
MRTLHLDTLGFVPRFRSSSVAEVPNGRTVLQLSAAPEHIVGDALIHVIPDDEPEWYGHVSAGDGDLSGLWCGPTPHHLTVVISGEGYLIPVGDPHAYILMDAVFPVCDVRRVPGADLLVVASFSDVAVYAASGVLWISRNVSQSDLHLTAISAEAIEGFADGGDFLISDIPFTINTRTGEVIRSGAPPWSQ